VERKWVIAAFLDLRDFRTWTSRAAISQEIKDQFLTEFYKGLQCYVTKHTDVWSKYEGDAIITAKEFTPAERKNPKAILKFILALRCLLRKSWDAIREGEMAPSGVRIRIMDGYVFKLMLIDPNDPQRKRLIPEYVDYVTNTLRGLLGVNPEIPCLATEGVVKRLGRRASLFQVKPLKKPSHYPKGVNTQDVDGLKILKF
jgi:hypothetical protein